MAQKDLRALFSANNVDLDAVRVFTNRQDERNSFDMALEHYLRSVRAGATDPQNLIAPRRNVQTFFGVGGIGKTTLSRQLEYRCHGSKEECEEWPPSQKQTDRLLTIRVDLSPENGLDYETMVVLLRSAFCSLQQPMVAFDLAFARYWTIAHPNQTLSQYLEQHSVLRRISNVLRLPDQIQGALLQAIGSLGIPPIGLGMLVNGATQIVNALRDRSRQRSALAGCARLPSLLEVGADLDALSYFPHLLAWDLHRAQQIRHIGIVVFVDTFEAVSGGSHRNIERLIQRIVWLMPNVLFVVTGRNRLDWDDRSLADQLDWVGPVSWPGLANRLPGETWQHLVGNLSLEDTGRYLASRLQREGRPAIPDKIRSKITECSHGLPLYLDLSVMRFLHLTSEGKVPTVADFDANFPSIVARVFRDLGGDERQALRAASLLDGFDIEIVTAGAGLTSEAAAMRLANRPFVTMDSSAQWPLQMHALVRSHVRQADRGLHDSWSPRDWQRAAQRMLDHLGRSAIVARRQRDRRALISYLNQGIVLAHEYDLPLGWLEDGAFWYVDDMTWEPTLHPRIDGINSPDPRAPVTSAEALATGLMVIGARQHQHRLDSANAIDRVLQANRLDGDLRDMLEYFRAECLRELRRPAESERSMRTLMNSGGRMSATAARGYAHMLRQTGRFRTMRALISEQSGGGGVWHRMSGDLLWLHGQLDEANQAFKLALDWATASGIPGEVAISASSLVFLNGLDSQPADGQELSIARRALSMANVSWARRFVACGEILAAAGDEDTVHRLAGEIVAECDRSGVNSSAVHAEFARAFHFAVVGNKGGLLAARAGVRARVTGADFAYLCEIVDFWLGASAPADDLHRSEWLDERRVVRERWREIVSRRRSSLAR